VRDQADTRRRIPQQARATERVELILTATAELLAEAGYARLTTNHVAKRAGVPVGSIYQYFPSKEALLIELCDRHTERVLTLLDEKIVGLGAGPIPLAVRPFVQEMIWLHAEDPALHQVIYANAPLLGDKVRDLGAEAAMRVTAWLSLHRRETRPKNLNTAGFVLARAVEAITHVAVRERPEDLEGGDLVDEIVALVLGYLGVPLESDEVLPSRRR
jgi:AcrR family transcriptional regulator